MSYFSSSEGGLELNCSEVDDDVAVFGAVKATPRGTLGTLDALDDEGENDDA